jgi:hypothetical protein
MLCIYKMTFDKQIKYITHKYCLGHIVRDMDENEIYYFMCRMFLQQDEIDVSNWDNEDFRDNLGLAGSILTDDDFELICDMLREKAREIYKQK